MIGITYRCRHFIIFMNTIANSNPECSESTSEANQAESEPLAQEWYMPQSRDECVDREYLVSCASVAFESRKRGGAQK